MATAKQLVEMADSFVGTSDTGQFNRDYYGYDNGAPYCCIFQWDMFQKCKAPELFFDGGKTASCTALLNWGYNRGLLVDLKDGRTGDLILFDWDDSRDADHVGMIKTHNSDGSYLTIEGNTSIGNNGNGGQVMRRTRWVGYDHVRAIIRPKYQKTVTYQVHQQTYGWLPFVDEGECAGYTGRSKRMESLRINSDFYDFVYGVHQQTYGDSKEFTNGQAAGVTGESKRIEGCWIKCYKKGTKESVKIRYRLHIQGTGWTGWCNNGEYCGTRGQSLRAEAIEIEFV